MASDFMVTWSLVRGRFDASVHPLNQAQLNWRLCPGTLTAGEAALHLAGVERWFCLQLLGKEPVGEEKRLCLAATDGALNENPFPFQTDEITPEFVKQALAGSAELVTSLMEEPKPEVMAVQIKSALGPIIDGRGAFARIAYHPGYHQGQVYMLAQHPDFPK